MGEHNVSSVHDAQQAQTFMKSLLADLAALERLIESGRIETGVRRIGAEQEMFLLDRTMRPAPLVSEVLAAANDPRLTTEIGKFNLEANLSPQLLAGDGLRRMEQELIELLSIARAAARQCGADVLLAGILPTLRQSDLKLDNLTQSPRYHELNAAMRQLRGGDFAIHIKGLDELHTTHDNILFEACCCSFQMHLQVAPEEFARLYNLAQVISAPLLAVAANSPLLIGHRLWHETRVALFQHSTDERSATRQTRDHPPRVSFGEGWVKQSVIEIFREEIARFRILLTKQIDEDPLAAVARGEIPQLAALRLHNGTVWRWNRPCYGVQNGVAHLRIEHRALPSGPSVLDEMANAAFFYGLMTALPDEYGAVEQRISFDDTKSNFFTAARYGLKTRLTWLDRHELSAMELIRDHLLPIAREGLRQAGVDTEDGNRFLDVVAERVERAQTGALWALHSLETLEAMGEQATRESRHQALTEAMLAHQQTEQPVARWPPAQTEQPGDWLHSHPTVAQLMSTDLFTIRPDDLADLAAGVMDWRHIRHIPVEDDEGRLVGLITSRDLLRQLAQAWLAGERKSFTAQEVMKRDLVTVTPETPTLEAMELMRTRKVGCLLVTENERLVGILTAYDFLSFSAEIIKNQLRQSGR
ncbi:MAG TPA: glutamate-cysteine ligase family protein [Blastocatellia bacterium]|nr:glutamate-cysteine ligase family protein [Blastocatellia bacterium]HMY73309.1 glutamate-cysteine ligase family protein [Blastocatellia bacterium]HMZ20148.1 glutamate-cysteine ligase family protein [Blastocatellia bacterium]HNG32491.1 glutamate-cysteine ligase family protein [Blastocatellia bacterium]